MNRAVPVVSRYRPHGFLPLRKRSYNPAAGRFTSMDPHPGDTEDPVTLHRFLYAGADPVSNADPNGMFFSAISAGITTAVQGLMNNSRVGGALYVLDRTSTFVDAVKFISQLAAGTVNPGLMAGLLLSMIPFSSVFRGAKLLWTGSVATGGKGVVQGAGKTLSEGFDALKAANLAGQPVTKVAGDLGAITAAKKLGLKPVDGFPAHYRGIDGMFMHGDDLVIVEAKGRLASSGGSFLGQTKHGEEMSQAWIQLQVEKIRRRTGDQYANLLRDKIQEGKVKGLVVETRVDEAGKLADPVFELKNWADIGVTTWVK
jgi:RHS repeat-associated protein